MPNAEKRIELPKTLQERMLKFFLKAEAMRDNAEKAKEPPEFDEPQNPININDGSSGNE